MPTDSPSTAGASAANVLEPRDMASWARLLSVHDLQAPVIDATDCCRMHNVLCAELATARNELCSHICQQNLELKETLVLERTLRAEIEKLETAVLENVKLNAENSRLRASLKETRAERSMRAEIEKLRTAVLRRDDENEKLNAENSRLQDTLNRAHSLSRNQLRRLRGFTAAGLDEAQRAELRAELEQALLRVEHAELRSEAEEVVAGAMPDGVCPMTKSLMRKPVMLADGNSYEKSFAEEWLLQEFARERPPQSPLTNAPLTHVHVTENHMLRKVITEAVDQTVLELKRRKQASPASAGAKRRRE